MEISSAQRFLLLQVINPHYHQDLALKNMAELEQLVATYGGLVVEKSIQHRVKPDPNSYIGSGKLAWLVEAVKKHSVDVVVINSQVKSGQLYRLEKALWAVNHKIKVWDRIDLILGIFELHSRSTESKLQIELARIQHQGPRSYGLGKTSLSRQGGGIGTRGKGETNIEFERRLLKERVRYLQKQLATHSKQKQRRIQFRKEQGFGPVALVGYTSAGKTTLFNNLTGKKKLAHASLFTTLDTVVGKLKIPQSKLPILISDTIGFIEDLPPALIAAFRSTLLESLESQIVIHVIDVNDEFRDRKIKVVADILRELQITQPIITLFNKIDQLELAQLEALKNIYASDQPVLVSAKTGDGIAELKQLLTDYLVVN